MDKYIQEKGIIALIKIYAESRIEEIFEIILKITFIMYYNALTNELIEGVNPFECEMIYVICMTNNNFIIFTQISTFDDNEDETLHIEINNIKFSKNKRQFYKNLLKESVDLDYNIFTTKYKNILDAGTKTIVNNFTMCQLYELLVDYNIKFYNIKFSHNDAWPVVYTMHELGVINQSEQIKDYAFNIRAEHNNRIDYLENIFVKTQCIIKYFNHSVNIHNID
jgi:hypothetical protein